jgi:uncharacterized membrane protein YjfL (UPF0719 family)
MATLGERFIETDFALSIFDWDNAVYIGLTLVVFTVARFIYAVPYWFILAERRCVNIDAFRFNEKLVKEDNKGVAVAFGAFIISLATIMNGQITSATDDKGRNIAYFVVWTLIGFALLFISRFLNVYLIVRSKDCIKSMAKEENIAVACVEAGSFIGMSFIIKAATAGDSQSLFWEDIVTTIIFFSMGQACFVVYIFVYQKIISKTNLQEQLMNRNAAIGISVGLNLIAIGYLIAIPITNSDAVLAYWVWFLLGSLVVFGVRFITNRLILWGEDLDKELVEDHNWGVAFIEGAFAIMIVAAMDTFLALDPNNYVNF